MSPPTLLPRSRSPPTMSPPTLLSRVPHCSGKAEVVIMEHEGTLHQGRALPLPPPAHDGSDLAGMASHMDGPRSPPKVSSPTMLSGELCCPGKAEAVITERDETLHRGGALPPPSPDHGGSLASHPPDGACPLVGASPANRSSAIVLALRKNSPSLAEDSHHAPQT